MCQLTQDLSMIAPKRPNWDLRRDYERQYAPLERQTRASIRTLIGASLCPACC